MARYFPICLALEGKRALVVGGGAVGTARARELIAAGALVTVVAPESSPAIRAAAAAGELALVPRPYRTGDSDGAFLVAVATSDPEANAAVFADATARGQLVNVCDDPAHCNYIFASTIHRGPLTVSIFTQGEAPGFSRRVRRELEAWLSPEYGELAALLGEIRAEIRVRPELQPADRQRILERLIYSEALLLFREGQPEEARALCRRLLEAELTPPGAG